MANERIQKIRSGQVSFGGWSVLNSFAAVDLLAQAGYDWVALDVEHATHSVQNISEQAALIKLRGAVPVARVFDTSPASIRRIVDAGVQGVIVPMVSSADDAKRAVDSVKLPPLGKRGVGAGAYASYGTRSREALRDIGDTTLVIADIETIGGVESIDEILSVEGIDGVFVGPTDLSFSLGLNGNTDNDTIRGALDRLLESCRKHGKFTGIHLMGGDASAIRDAVARGYTFIALGFDAQFIADGAEKLLKNAAAVAGAGR